MKKINFKNAFGEVFYIFLGITLAIAFQNWNEQQKQNDLEKNVIEQLKVALNNDLEDVNSNIKTHLRAQKGCQILLNSLNSKIQINDTLFMKAAIQSSDYTFLVSDISTYEYLKSVGLHIIQKDSLRSQITKLYDVVYEGIYGIENNAKPIQRDILNHVKKYFSADINSIMPIGNINEAKKNNALKFDIKNLEFSHQIMINRYKEKVKPELEKLIQMVDQELMDE